MKKSSYNIGYILFLAVVAACGGFLFGYDTAVISGTIKQVTTLFGLNDIEQGWYVGCALVGSIAGVAVAGTMSDRSSVDDDFRVDYVFGFGHWLCIVWKLSMACFLSYCRWNRNRYRFDCFADVYL